MSILIKGMEMPKHCGECGIEWCEKWKRLIIGGMSIAKTRPSDCPLIEIPDEDVQPAKWISVEEQLPQGGDESGQLCENVILMLSVEYNEAYVTCGWINGITKKAYYIDEIDDFIHKTDISNVKAWMPLPEPPKDGET